MLGGDVASCCGRCSPCLGVAKFDRCFRSFVVLLASKGCSGLEFSLILDQDLPSAQGRFQGIIRSFVGILSPFGMCLFVHVGPAIQPGTLQYPAPFAGREGAQTKRSKALRCSQISDAC